MMVSRKILLLLILPIILGLIVGSQITNDVDNEQEELIQDSCNLRTENNNNNLFLDTIIISYSHLLFYYIVNPFNLL